MNHSFSKLSTFETCPRQYYHKYVAKDLPFTSSPALELGNRFHSFAEAFLTQDGAPKSEEFSAYVPGLKKLLGSRAEVKISIDKNLTPCKYREAWFRGAIDVLKVEGGQAKVVDFKTGGKVQRDSFQIMSNAWALMCTDKSIDKVVGGYWYIKLGVFKSESHSRADLPDMTEKMRRRIEIVERAAKESDYPPKPSGLCNGWCDVKTCPHNGG